MPSDGSLMSVTALGRAYRAGEGPAQEARSMGLRVSHRGSPCHGLTAGSSSTHPVRLAPKGTAPAPTRRQRAFLE